MANLKEQASQRSRQRLIDAATDLFSRQGYENTSIDQIAQAAGISRGSIFWHFESKAGLLLSVVDCAFARWREYWAALTSPAPPPSAAADDTVAASEHELRPALDSMFAVFRAWSRDPCARLMPMLLFEALRDDSPLRESYAERYRAFRQMFAEWADHHRDESWPPELDSSRFATVVWGALIGTHLQWRLDPDRVDFDAALEALEAMLSRLERGAARETRVVAGSPAVRPPQR